MEKEFDLGITEDELERVEEDLDVEDIDDFDLEETKVVYEIWVLGFDQDYNATDFECLVDDGYLEEAEARKCFEFFSEVDNLAKFMEKIEVPENTKHLHLFLEECIEVDDGDGGTTTECQDILEEIEII